MRTVLLMLATATALPAAAQSPCDNCGRIEEIRTVRESAAWTPLGTMGSVGAGTGRTTTAFNLSTGSMVVLGAAGGAGYAKRPQSYERPRWEIAVRMDAGGTRLVSQAYEPALRVGDRVRVFGAQLELAN